MIQPPIPDNAKLKVYARHFKTKEEFSQAVAERFGPYIYQFGDWWYNWINNTGSFGTPTPREGEVLKVLLDACPLPVHYQELIKRAEKIHGYPLPYDEVRVLIRKLRITLGDRRYIQCTRGIGYWFEPFPEEEQTG